MADARLCNNAPREKPPPTVVEPRTEHIPQQYSAHLASSATCPVMLDVYRDVNPRFP
jgi:hypothetical protein